MKLAERQSLSAQQAAKPLGEVRHAAHLSSSLKSEVSSLKPECGDGFDVEGLREKIHQLEARQAIAARSQVREVGAQTRDRRLEPDYMW